MSKIITFLNQIVLLPGVLEAGCITGGRKVALPSGLTPAQARQQETIWQAVADTYQVCKLHRRPATRLHWRFERATLCSWCEAGDWIVAFLADPGAAAGLPARVAQKWRETMLQPEYENA